MEYSFSENMKRDFIKEVITLDSLVYPEYLQGTYQSVKSRFQKNIESYVLLHDEDMLIGYICFFPISDSVCNKIIVDKAFVDDDITEDQIMSYEKNVPVNLYVISIVVHPEYQNTEAIVMLANGFFSKLTAKRDEGYCIRSIIASAVSDDGNKLLLRWGFKVLNELDNGYRLYIRDENCLED